MFATATSLLAEDLTTLTGTKYTGITVTRIEADSISISHDDGLAKIPFTDLPDSLRAKYAPQPTKPPQVSQSPATPAPVKPTEPAVGGFLNVPWGTPHDKAKEIISQREGVLFDDKESNDQIIFFTGGTFSDFRVSLIGLRFVDNQFYSGFVTVKGATVETTWGDLMTGLTKKYGHGGSSPSRLFGSWRFPNADKPIETISCLGSIGEGTVMIQYENNPLAARAAQAHQQSIKTKDL